MAKSDLVDVEVFEHHQTLQAIRVSLDGDDQNGQWLPLSQVEIERSLNVANPRIITVTLPEWLAMEKELI